jgi:phosphoglycerate dehydrogenase-like enzyme
LPKTAHTTHYFNKDFYAMMKPSSIFMNIGRGVTVKESDLVDALKAKVIAGAVLDVFEVEPLSKESELWDLPNVLMTPHCAD